MRLVLAFLLLALAMTANANPAPDRPGLDRIVLGGGCFWCIEAVYELLDGVESAVSGYSGGKRENPSYAYVSTGVSGHIEVVEVTYDPARLPLPTLLDVFFTAHDPTTKDRQGNDVGPQYGSVAFYRDEAQKAAIDAAIARAQGKHRAPIVTAVRPLEKFWPAEDYHQEYYALHGEEPYCSLVIAPKVAKVRKEFAGYLRR